MPQDTKLAHEQWERYTYCRDLGHLQYVQKARKCEEYFAGKQWDPQVAAMLKEQRRPALTINKILGTLSNILGEQIDLRTEIAYKSTMGANSSNADILTKVFKHISSKNQLDWVRSELFADGAITSRGFIDIRMNFDKSITGDVVIENRNPRNVIPDPDAAEYDPDKWNDVICTHWLNSDQIEMYYNKKDAELLRDRSSNAWAYDFDSLDWVRDRFGGGMMQTTVPPTEGEDNTTRMIRIIERQYRRLTKAKFFINLKNGDKKEIPDTWDREKIAAYLAQQKGGLAVDERVHTKIRWTVTADDIVLHDKWSPYKHFTIVPYFPYFRYGTTIGLVENLIDVQELLNKTTSQELHVVNTMANSGWKVKKGSLKNMTMDELETMGAKTGVVLELDDVADAEKIQPNQIPQGLDRLSAKAENYIKAVSMRGDAQMGMTRADVSADQIEANNAYGDVGLRKALDNLKRTDEIIARNVLDLVQEYYTDPRIMMITKNALTGEQEQIQINWPDPEFGELQNDVSMGEYDVEVISQPAKQTLEQSQFEQAAYLKEKLGVKIPDEFLIENSNLVGKHKLVQAIKAANETPEAQMMAKNQLLQAQLTTAELKAEAAKTEADAILKRAKAAESIAKAQKEAAGEPGEAEKAAQEMSLEQQKHTQEMAMQREKHAQEMQIEREKAAMKIQLEREMAKEKQLAARAEAIMKQKQAEKVAQASPKDVVQSMGGGGGANKPQSQSGAK